MVDAFKFVGRESETADRIELRSSSFYPQVDASTHCRSFLYTTYPVIYVVVGKEINGLVPSFVFAGLHSVLWFAGRRAGFI
jgi:hypothetical protein